MEETIKDTTLSFSLFRKQVNDDFFELIKPLPQERIYVSTPPYLMHYVSRMIPFNENPWLRLISFDKIKEDTGPAVLVIISPSERTNIELILDKFKIVPKYIKSLFIMPRITAIIQQVFDMNNVKVVKGLPKSPDEINVQEFHYDFLPVDDDYLLLPCYRSFLQINADLDYNDLYSTARALAKIQTVFGEIPQVISIGKHSIYTKTLMKGLLRVTGSLSTQIPLIDSIVLFDRSCDLVTPLSSQITFEGIVDEIFGINFGICETNDTKYKSIILSEKVDIVSKTRGELMQNANKPLLDMIAECKLYEDHEYCKSLIKSDPNGFNKMKTRSIYLSSQKQQLDELFFLCHSCCNSNSKTNPFHQVILQEEYSTLIHSASDFLIPTAESCIQFFNDWKTALRLVLLQLVVNNKGVDSQLLIQSLVDQYGEKAKNMVKVLDRLELLKSDHKIDQQFQVAKKVLSLTSHKDKSGNDDLLSMCDNIIPMILRIIQFCFSEVEKQNKIFDLGCPVDITGELPEPVPGKPRKILVFFIGGVTISEVDFIRKFGKVISNNKLQFIVGGTDQINNNNFVDQLCLDLFD